MKNKTTAERGKQAEIIACEFLQQQKLTLVAKNYYSRQGEIDLIMEKDKMLIFVEVRQRNNNNYMDTVETIHTQKCQRIIRTAEHYLLNEKRFTDHDFRFDVVLINGTLSQHEIEWIKDAFQA